MLSQNYLLPTISVLAENTLLKTACHFLLLLVGFDTPTYQKDYDRSPILVGHQLSKKTTRSPEGNVDVETPSSIDDSSMILIEIGVDDKGPRSNIMI